MKCKAALDPSVIWFSYGSVSRKFYRRSHRKRSGGHHHFAVITGHIPRFRSKITVYRAAALDSLAESHKTIFVPESQRLNNISSLRIIRRSCIKSESAEKRGNINGALQCCPNRMGHVKQPHIKFTVHAESSAYFFAETWRS